MTAGVPPGLSRETSIRRTADGRWFHDGMPIRHPGIRKAFDAWVGRADDGRYVLQNDVNWAYIEIEGAPVRVDRVRLNDDTPVLELSDERTEPLRLESLRQDADGHLYCDVRDGRLTAQFTRQALFDLEPLLREDERGIYLEVAGRAVVPPVEAEPVR
jgi:hypothetical protein